MKCKVCGREATRLHARHDDGTLEYLCEEHYGYWHPELAESRKNCLLEAKYAPIRIPENLIARLQPLGPHFIRVAKRGKEPIDKDWPRKPLFADDPKLQAWLREGGNYGVVGGFGLVIVDIDLPELKEIVRERLPPTFTVQSPGSGGWHLYYLCSLERPIRLRDKDGENIGDIQGSGKMVVGPGSIHPVSYTHLTLPTN